MKSVQIAATGMLAATIGESVAVDLLASGTWKLEYLE